MSKRVQKLAAAAAVAVIAVAAVIAAQAGGAKTATTKVEPAVVDLKGIPEDRGVLGSPRAKVTLTEFVDPQCPVCAAASEQVLPALVDDDVRTGKVKLDARVLHFLGPDSTRAAKYAAAAREQSRLWPFLETLYANQGEEHSGWATPRRLDQIARAAGVVPGQAGLGTADAEARRLGVTGTPTFVLTRDGKQTIVPVGELQQELDR